MYGGRLPDFAMVRWTDGQTKRQINGQMENRQTFKQMNI